MNRTLLLAHLARAERLVLQGEARLANQEALLAQLERHGHPADEARELLATIRQAQALHIGDRDRIRKELEQAEARWKLAQRHI
jgi:hypothetical protein